MNFLEYCKNRKVRIETSYRAEDDHFTFIFYHEDGYAQEFDLSSLEAYSLDKNLESYLVALAEIEYQKQRSAAMISKYTEPEHRVFLNKRDAELVLASILDVVEKYGFISV
jgi:hypothetical protein